MNPGLRINPLFYFIFISIFPFLCIKKWMIHNDSVNNESARTKKLKGGGHQAPFSLFSLFPFTSLSPHFHLISSYNPFPFFPFPPYNPFLFPPPLRVPPMRGGTNGPCGEGSFNFTSTCISLQGFATWPV